MGIKQYIPKSLNTNFRFISLNYSKVTDAKEYAKVIQSKVAVEKSVSPSVYSSSDLISAIEFIFIPILILFGASIGLYWWRKRTSKTQIREERPEPTPNSHSQPIPLPEEEYQLKFQSLEQTALNNLRRAKTFRERGQISQYCAAISLAIKKYVGEKYNIKIVEASTSQILDSLPQELTDSVFDYVGEILRTCDMISLARHRPSRGELDHVYQIATEFIQSQIQPDATETEDEKSEESDEADEPPEWFNRYQ